MVPLELFGNYLLNSEEFSSFLQFWSFFRSFFWLLQFVSYISSRWLFSLLLVRWSRKTSSRVFILRLVLIAASFAISLQILKWRRTSKRGIAEHISPSSRLVVSLFEILAELGLSFSQMCPNLLCQLLAILVRAREENLRFSLDELRHLFLIKRNNQSPRTLLMSLRPGRHVIGGLPYRDEKWREQFFVFRVDSGSMGDFDFSRLPRLRAEDIGELLTLFSFAWFR